MNESIAHGSEPSARAVRVLKTYDEKQERDSAAYFAPRRYSQSRNSRITGNSNTTERATIVTETSVEARVHAAADEIEREGGKPTVVTVRARVGVNNGDATRFLRSWREAKLAAGASIASLPPGLFEQMQRVAGLMWAEASQLASSAHAAVEREWLELKALQETEIAELVESLDTTERAAMTATEAHAAEKDALAAELETTRDQKAQAVLDLQTARQENAELEKRIIEERAAARALRTTIDALIVRIPPSDETK